MNPLSSNYFIDYTQGSTYNSPSGGLTVDPYNNVYGTGPNLVNTANTINVDHLQPMQELQPISTSGSSGTGTTGPSAAELEAQRAESERQAKLNKARSSVSGLVNSIRGVYDALYGNLDTAVADQTKLVNRRFDQENADLTDQFQTQFGSIGKAFASRGAYDSSFRGDSERTAQKQFDTTLTRQNQARQGELSGIGNYLAQTRAGIQGGRESLNLFEQQANQTESVEEIERTINELQARKVELQQQAAGTGPQNYYLNQLKTQVPSSSQFARARADVTNIISAQIPAPVKASIVNNLINSLTLSPEEKQQLVAEFSGVVSQEEEKA